MFRHTSLDNDKSNTDMGLNIKTVFPGEGIPITKIRRSWDRLIFIMGILILVWKHLYFGTVPKCHHNTVETPYSTIPYTTIFYITRWTHGPQNLQRPIRTLIVLLGFWITNLRVICLFTARAVDCEQLNEPTCGLLPGSTMTAGPITSDFHTLRPFPLESIIISGVFTKD